MELYDPKTAPQVENEVVAAFILRLVLTGLYGGGGDAEEENS